MALPSLYRVRRSIFSFGFLLAGMMGGLTADSHAGLPSTRWIWADGGNLNNQPGIYGNRGLPHHANTPGARKGAATWKDAQDNLWLFGGYGYDRLGALGWLSDLWKYNPTTGQWTWIHGPDEINWNGAYGSQGSPSSGVRPGGRYRAVTWTDSQGRFWLFGGDGFPSFGASGQLNDLWVYDPSTGSPSSGKWTWIDGSANRNDPGVYGPQGVSSSSFVPPNRSGAVGWADASGNLWLFGGLQMFGSGTSSAKLNDLWKFNIENRTWAWMKGTTATDVRGEYGSQGNGTPSTRPGSRFLPHAWSDTQGRMWLFGGSGYGPATGVSGLLSDLWCYDPATNNWTWMKGPNAVNQFAKHGSIVFPSNNNVPGGMTEGLTWKDARGDLWLYGGTGYAEAAQGELSSLWRYRVSTNQWTWMNGSSGIAEAPVFGTPGYHDPGNANTPGGQHAAAAWLGAFNKLYLFGGESYDTTSGSTFYQALWQLTELYGISVNSGQTPVAPGGTISIGNSPIGAGVQRIFTIKNTSLNYLTGLNVGVLNAHNGSFVLTTPPASNLAPGAETEFTITFTADSVTTATATLEINGSNLDPFTINATGTGVLRTVTVALNQKWIWEDGAVFLEYTFTRNGGLATPLTVNFSVSGTATLDTDYFVSDANTFTASAGSVIIPSGSATATLKIVPISDATLEIEENVQLNLVPTAQYNPGTSYIAHGIIASEELLPGGRDRAFFPEITGNNVTTTAIQPDGKLVIGGGFTSVNGVACNHLARLQPDGSFDSSFAANLGVFWGVQGILVQPDGRILIAGGDTGITRLLSDGSSDPSFTSPFSLTTITAIAQQPDGKILVGGDFITVGVETRNRLARLNTDGTLDPTFDPGAGANDWVECLAVQPDGRILVGGSFTSFGGQSRTGITRLNPNGTLDPDFDAGSGVAGGYFPAVLSLAIQPDGRILIGGEFTGYNGQSRIRVARLESNGSLDPSFNPAGGPDDYVYTLAPQTDGKVLIGGYFSTVNGQNSPSLARLNANGTFDLSFYVSWGPTNGVLGITLLADGQVIACGNSSIVDEIHSPISRRANDPATQTLRPASGSVAQWQRAGSGPELSRMTFDLSTDGGANWSPLGAGTRITGGWEISGQTIPMTGQLRARGYAISGHLSSSSSIIEQIQAFTRAPEIIVEDINNISLVDGVSSFDFGPQPVPQPLVGPGSRSFTLRNTGNADLTDLSVLIDGSHAGDFYFNGPFPYTAPLAPGAVRNLLFTFTPLALGNRTATLHIGNNDADENPFDITFTGLGATAKEVWRHTNFGSIANSGPGADAGDPDGDGNSNDLEFLAGLNPNNINARFQVRTEAVSGAPNQRKILFTALPLSGTPNIVIQYSTSLRENDWHPLNSGPINTSGPEWFVIDTDVGGPMKFYRIELSLP